MSIKIGIVAIIKNIDNSFFNWVDFHRVQSFDKFYIFLNNELSKVTQKNRNRLKKYQCIHLFERAGSFSPKLQIDCYNFYIHNINCPCTWVAFIDDDEFLFSPNRTIKETLIENYKDDAAIFVNWVNYGNLTQSNSKNKAIYEKYLHRAKLSFRQNYIGKLIVKKNMVLKFKSAHFCLLKHNLRIINENKEKAYSEYYYNDNKFKYTHFLKRKLRAFFELALLPIPILNDLTVRFFLSFYISKKISVNRLRINHYQIQDYEVFKERKWAFNKTRRSYCYYKYMNKCEVYDPVLLNHNNELS